LFLDAKQLSPGTATLSIFIIPSKRPGKTLSRVFQAGSEQRVVVDVIGFQRPGTFAS
jgi:hypothetical protein